MKASIYTCPACGHSRTSAHHKQANCSPKLREQRARLDKLNHGVQQKPKAIMPDWVW
jgi:hypothetical protein